MAWRAAGQIEVKSLVARPCHHRDRASAIRRRPSGPPFQEGAFDYLTKPFDYEQVLKAIERALHSRRHRCGRLATYKKVDGEAEEIVGRGPAMQAIFRRIALVAPRDACVLITGESGTGKELVARAIHRYSPQSSGPFLAIHVAALNEQLVESELFGHIKGAFTGAEQAHVGLYDTGRKAAYRFSR